MSKKSGGQVVKFYQNEGELSDNNKDPIRHST